MTIQALEPYRGIDGFAAATTRTNLRVVGALHQSPTALSVYRLNSPGHGARQVNLETITSRELESFRADFWWVSPPCQPYTVRGVRRILDVFPELAKDRHKTGVLRG